MGDTTRMRRGRKELSCILIYNLLFILQWLETDFLGYLEEWQKTVEERKGFTASEKKTMLLSDETATGLKLTGTHKTMDVIQLEELCDVTRVY